MEKAKNRPSNDEIIFSAFRKPNYDESVISKFTIKGKPNRTIGPKAVFYSNEPLYLYHGNRPCVRGSSTINDKTLINSIFRQLSLEPKCNYEPESLRLMRKNMGEKKVDFSQTNMPKGENSSPLLVPKLNEVRNYVYNENVLIEGLRQSMNIAGKKDIPPAKELKLKAKI